MGDDDAPIRGRPFTPEERSRLEAAMDRLRADAPEHARTIRKASSKRKIQDVGPEKNEMNNAVKVLDHGYIKMIEHWGSDERIIEAARMSTDKGFLGWGTPENPGDEKLLGYLYKNNHATPFEMAGAIIEVQAPIFVFREWHRHRTQSYNEMSARYTPLPDLNYIPTVERLLINSKTNKQAGTIKGAAELTEFGAWEYQDELSLMYENQQRFYEKALQSGVPKELARNHLPVGRYSKMRASTCLRNWLGFLTLRMAPGAQFEIREYARELHDILKPIFPRTLALFDEGAKV